VIGEAHNRIYYIEGSTLYASFTPEPTPDTGSGSTGGPPTQKWRVGVPNPTVAPTLSLVNRTDLADYPAAAFSFSAWWDANGTRYGEVVATSTVVTALREYLLTGLPAVPSEAPEGAVLAVQAQLKDGPNTLFTLDTTTAAGAPVRSSALPGGVEMSLKVDGGNYTVAFTWGIVETRAYVYTKVNSWDEESGPSPAALISPTYVQDVKIVITMSDFTTFRAWKENRVYRTFGSGTYIRATIKDIEPPDLVTFIDASRTVGSAGTALQSLTWEPCPLNVHGLVALPNGWFACYSGNTLYMSVPYRPHTWPYKMTFPNPIRGICAGPQQLVVTTSATAYSVLGPHPGAAASHELQIPCGGISQRSMVKTETGVIYLSNDGPVLVEGSVASLALNQSLFTRKEWQLRYGEYLETLALGYHDGCLICVNTDQKVAEGDPFPYPKGFIIRLDEAVGSFTEFNYVWNAMFRLPWHDSLYYTANGNLYQFRAGAPLNASWKSKSFTFKEYTKLGIGYIDLNGLGTVRVNAYVDNDTELVHSEEFNATEGPKYFRLPAHRGSLNWSFELIVIGDTKVTELAFAHTMDQLKKL
jgi:hypothetical protein